MYEILNIEMLNVFCPEWLVNLPSWLYVVIMILIVLFGIHIHPLVLRYYYYNTAIITRNLNI